MKKNTFVWFLKAIDVRSMLQKSKCLFVEHSLTFLEVLVDVEDLHMDKEATGAVMEAPQPTHLSDLQSCPGTC